ncbi:MAG: hypothetical protein Q9170_006298, partial [Blastenia crenularia]
MASQRPLRTRPNLHLALTQQTGSPRNPKPTTSTSSHFSSPYSTPTGTPLAATPYSSFQSAQLQAPSPHGGPMRFTPRQKHKIRRYGRAAYLRTKRILSTRLTWLILVVILAMTWWLNGGGENFDAVAAGFSKEMFQDGITQDLQFFPPSNPKIHNTGVYFDVKIKNTTSLLLSLRNTPLKPIPPAEDFPSTPSTAVLNNGHISFRPDSARNKPAPPISLLARVDQEDYVLLPNSSALVAICTGSLQRDAEHNIRIIAPMTDDHGTGVVQLEGLWLSKGGQFDRIEGTSLHDNSNDEDLLVAESGQVGEKHRTGLSNLLKGNGNGRVTETQEVLKDHEEPQDYRSLRKLLEVVTDTPGLSGRGMQSTRTGGAHGLLAGVMGWEYLLGEMFGVDHVAIGVEGMCLIQDCIGGVGQPAGLGDIFFRSGPPGSAFVEHPWLFDCYVPDVLNLGNSDKASFDRYGSDYNKSAWDLAEGFESTYVSLIKAIRNLAYPKHPATILSEHSGYKFHVPNTVPASIPIFIMRPLRGELEHSTQNIVNRLCADGDTAIFWLDTSGWLDPNVSPDGASGSKDFYLDDSGKTSLWRLSERGNQRVAIFLHMHVCRYLAREGEKCPFLPAETYRGKVFDPEERDFE